MHYSTVNLFALAAGAMAQGYGASNVSYTTVFVTDLTTVCPGPTSFVAGGIEYTITEATTLTITDCSCTHVLPMSEYTPGSAYVQPTPAPYVSGPAPVASSPAYIPAPAPYVPAPAPYVPVGTGSYTAASPTAASPAFAGAATVNTAGLSIAGLAGVAVLALAL